MTQNPDNAVNTLTGIHTGMAAGDARRQQQREQTLEWISINAFSTLRSVWSEAKLSDSGSDYAFGPGTSDE